MIWAVFKRCLQALCLVILVGAVSLVFLLSSATGARFLLQSVAPALAEGLDVQAVEGSLLGSLELRGVHYQSPAITAKLDALSVHWQPRRLLQRDVLLKTLVLDGVNLQISESEQASEPFTGMLLPETLGLPVSLRLESATVKDLKVRTASSDIRLASLSLLLNLEREARSSDNSLEASWSDLSLHASDTNTASSEPLLASRSGDLQIDGQTTSHQSAATLQLLAQNGQAARLSLSGEGDQRGITINVIESELLGGALTGKAAIDWSQSLSGRIAFEGDGFDPAQWDERMPGDLDVAARATFGDDRVALEHLVIKGVVREQSVNASAVLAIANGQLALESLTGTVGSSRLSASGEMGGQPGSELDFQWSLSSPDLSTLLPELSGRIASQGTVGGTRESPSVKAALTADDARYKQYAVSGLVADIAMDLTRGGRALPSNIDIKARELKIGENQITGANADLRGTLESHRVNLRVDGDQGRLSAVLEGGYDAQTWTGVWQQGAVEPVDMPAWTLQKSHALSLGSDIQYVERACWAAEQGGEGRLCFNADRDAGETTIDFALSALAFDYFELFLPEDLGAEGALSARGEVRQSAGGPMSIAAEVRSSASRIYRLGADAGELAQSISLDPGVAALNGTLAELIATVDVPFAAGGGLQGEIGFRDVQAGADLSGTVTASFPDLSFVELLSPEIEKVRGSAALDITLGGTLRAPRPVGDLRATNVSLSLSTPGIYVEEVNLTASADSDGAVKMAGSAVSDGGLLRLKGAGRLAVVEQNGVAAVELASFRSMVTGDEFQFWNTGDASVWGSPALALSVLDGKLRFDGNFVVPRANITPTQLPPNAARPTSDQVIVLSKSELPEGARPEGGSMPVFGSLQMTLGEQVSIDGFGFEGRITGDLGIELAPGKPILASGELNVVDGEYRAFGQGLVVERGQFLFAGGDIENPGLNIRAQRQPAADVVVGVNVTGQLQSPSLKIFSEPSMSSSNQLAWLVLGRPFESTSGAETDYIAQAALMLGIQGGDYLAKGFGEKLGLDTVGIETGSGEAGAASDVNQAALVVGKYLTPKLYISYGVGLLDSISTVKLRYQISDRWNLATESSPVASGGDINFTIER